VHGYSSGIQRDIHVLGRHASIITTQLMLRDIGVKEDLINLELRSPWNTEIGPDKEQDPHCRTQ
jgi:hypothetical protein